MKSARKSIVVLSVVLAVVFALSSSALARGYGKGGGGCWSGQGPAGTQFGLRGVMGLDLSDTQRDQAIKIRENHQINRIKAQGDLLKAHDALSKALQADTIDEKAVRDAYKKVSSLREDRIVARAKMANEMKAILTPEQIKVLDERAAAVSDWKQSRRGSGKPFAGRLSGECPRW